MKNHLKLTSLCPTAKACQSRAVGQLPVSALSGPVAPRCSESGKISSECAVTRDVEAALRRHHPLKNIGLLAG